LPIWLLGGPASLWAQAVLQANKPNRKAPGVTGTYKIAQKKPNLQQLISAGAPLKSVAEPFVCLRMISIFLGLSPDPPGLF
jgi:hypothetical protein